MKKTHGRNRWKGRIEMVHSACFPDPAILRPMQRWMTTLCAVLVVILLAAPLYAAEGGNPTGYPHFFSTKGTSIVDLAGKEVRFYGMNLAWPAFFSYAQAPAADCYQDTNPAAGDYTDNQVRFQKEFFPVGQPWGVTRHQADTYFIKFKDRFIRDEDLKRMHQYGVNLVRFIVAWRDFDRLRNGVPEPYYYLDKLVPMARNHGIYIQICLMLENVDDANTRDLISASGANGDQFRRAFQDRWAQIAARYSNEPVVAVYDLISEPAWWGADQNRPANYNRAFYATIQAIRKVDRNHLIAVEGDHWAKADGDPELLTKPHPLDNSAAGDPSARLLWSFHIYRQDDPAPDAANPAAFWQRVRELQMKRQVPVQVGEIGLHPGQFAWGKANFDLFAANRWSWLYWSWKETLPGYFAPYHLYPSFYESALPHSHSFTDFVLDLELAHLFRNQNATLDALFSLNAAKRGDFQTTRFQLPANINARAADAAERHNFVTCLNCNLKRFNGYQIDPKVAGSRAALEAALTEFQKARFAAVWPWPDGRFDQAMDQLAITAGHKNTGWNLWNDGDNLEAVLRSRLGPPP
jgi:hypothetical protein